MSTVYTAGEVVYDIIFKNNIPVSSCPGGSMLNTAVSLGRTGTQVCFIGECGTDKLGDEVTDFLSGNGVNIDFVQRVPGKQTTIALAFLDDRQEAGYSFYPSEPGHEHFRMPEFRPGDVFLFGSFFSISPVHREKVYPLIHTASGHGSRIMYDPNFRKPHRAKLNELFPFIERNIQAADLIRGSGDDFELIFGTRSAEETAALPCFSPEKTLIYTDGGKEISLFAPSCRKVFSVPELKPVSTIGAGDGFNAGIISGINSFNNQAFHELGKEQWEHIIETGISFAQSVCQRMENYVPVGYSL
jgi:fructokinase